MTDLFRLDGKTALVTGGAGNLGSGISRALAAAGASVAVSFYGDRGRAEQLVDELKELGPGGALFSADLRNEAEVKNLAAEVAGRFGTVDILVNNSGIFSLSRQEDLPAAGWDALFAVNVRGLFLCSQVCIPHMKKEGGVIINIASINSLHPGFGRTAHYDASKGAVAAYTRSLAAELGPEGIRVNAIAPGLISSAHLKKSFPELVSLYAGRAPLGRLVGIEDVGNAAVFLASGAASAVTGEILTVDCGYLLT
jgi:3-oxoacyl-[acyl-carrier protein] reductase